MVINKKTLAYLAGLSRLSVEADKEEKLISDLEKIVASFNDLQQLSTEKAGDEPVVKNNLRADEPRQTHTDDTLLLDTDENGYISVPPIL